MVYHVYNKLKDQYDAAYQKHGDDFSVHEVVAGHNNLINQLRKLVYFRNGGLRILPQFPGSSSTPAVAESNRNPRGGLVDLPISQEVGYARTPT